MGRANIKGTATPRLLPQSLYHDNSGGPQFGWLGDLTKNSWSEDEGGLSGAVRDEPMIRTDT